MSSTMEAGRVALEPLGGRMVVGHDSAVGPVASPRTLADVFDLAASRGGAPFFSYLDDLEQPPAEAMSYGEFHHRATQVAVLLQRAGLRPGDRVALVALPRSDYVTVLAGAVLAGAVPAPINHHFKERELAGYLTVLRPAVVVVDDTTAGVAAAALEQSDCSPQLAGISGCTAGDLDLLRDCDADLYERPRLAGDDPALVLHSSGTTGFPKAVVRSHETVTAFVNWFADYFDADEHMLNFLPFYHQAGLVLTLLTSVRLGCDIVQQSRYSTSSFWDLVDRYGATHMNLMAPVPTFLLSAPVTPEDRQHPLRWVVIAGRNDHWADFQERFGVTGMTFYGSTETLQITSTGHPGSGPVSRSLLEAAGHGIFTGRTIGDRTQFRLVDTVGEVIEGPDREGQIEVRGEFLFTGYLNDEDATRAAFTPDGWFRTGDIGRVTDDGQLVLIGRGGGMIRRSGENIAPREIEMVLEDHPAIQDAIVIGVPDEFRGQEIVARIVPVAPGSITADEVFDYLEEHVSSFKVPRYVVFHTHFDRTPTFKIQLGKYQRRLPDEVWIDRTAHGSEAR